MFEQSVKHTGCTLAENIGEYIVQLEVAHSQAVLGAVLLTGYKTRQLDVVAAQIAKLANVRRRDKAGTHQVALEKLGNPLGVFLVGFLALDRFDVLGVRQADVAGLFKAIEHRNPVFAG